ncbi:MAG: hypothetical protein P8X46_12010, partial [Nitrospirales bacterium]
MNYSTTPLNYRRHVRLVNAIHKDGGDSRGQYTERDPETKESVKKKSGGVQSHPNWLEDIYEALIRPLQP